MPVQLMPTFLSTLAFGIQFLIFVYLYSSHRVLFFRYLLWAWGFFTLSRGLRLLRVFIPGTLGVPSSCRRPASWPCSAYCRRASCTAGTIV